MTRFQYGNGSHSPNTGWYTSGIFREHYRKLSDVRLSSRFSPSHQFMSAYTARNNRSFIIINASVHVPIDMF